MPAPTVFLSAASIDLEPLRIDFDAVFSRAGFLVVTQDRSLPAAPGDVRRLLTEQIDECDCVIHLAGLGYGSDAQDPFLDQPDFRCSWTQFEYYYAHATGKDVIAFVCAPELSLPSFVEEGDDAERVLKAASQAAHRERVASGVFDDTPLADKISRTSNEKVESERELRAAIGGAIGAVHRIAENHPKEAEAVAKDLTTSSSLHQLPPFREGFVGREDDLDTLRATDPGAGALLTGLGGMGGIGKTALALVLAHEWRVKFPDAQIWLDGFGTRTDPPPPTAGDLIAQVVRAFHPEAGQLPEDEAALAALYRQVLEGKKALIVLDNAADLAQAGPLVPPAGCGLIVTSRRNFMLGNRPPLLVGRLPEPEAVALLREFWPALGDEDAAAVADLCAGLPLALRLAGAHLALDAAERGAGGVPDVAGYLAALKGGRLATLDADAPDVGEITIAETLRLSVDALSAEERAAWLRLGVFAGSFDARAAAAVANGADESRLSRLVRRNLLERRGDGRYRLHDLAAEYARNRLASDEESRGGGESALHAAHLAHARHYAAVGHESIQLYLKGDPLAGLALFDRERAQIESAFTWLHSRSGDGGAPDADQVLLALVDSVVYARELRFHPRQSIAWLEAQVDAARRVGNRSQEGNALGNLGIAHKDLGDARRAIEYHNQALIVSRAIGDRRAEAQDLGNLGLAHAALGDAGRAIEYHEQDLEIAREVGDQLGEGQALGNLGLAHATLGDARQAIEYYEQALIVSREIGNRHGEGQDLGNLGNAHLALGDARRALSYYEQQLEIVREIGDRRGEGNALWNSALALNSLGERAEAVVRAEAALEIREAIEDPNAAKVRAKLEKWREG